MGDWFDETTELRFSEVQKIMFLKSVLHQRDAGTKRSCSYWWYHTHTYLMKLDSGLAIIKIWNAAGSMIPCPQAHWLRHCPVRAFSAMSWISSGLDEPGLAMCAVRCIGCHISNHACRIYSVLYYIHDTCVTCHMIKNSSWHVCLQIMWHTSYVEFKIIDMDCPWVCHYCQALHWVRMWIYHVKIKVVHCSRVLIPMAIS